ncbi:hypothetical protein BTN50_0502 [Candidatus Enterovibrio altilux]|uniref:Uncharacterized protein n=1 Tax=Candidatus Enterovibrio altilux TaxID=1927128 RepID=A0A291B7R0_9GAMM|nr:hypothetical protein BTN50_0502 [Candidatus Enterovibrio luxaltus]
MKKLLHYNAFIYKICKVLHTNLMTQNKKIVFAAMMHLFHSLMPLVKYKPLK